MTTERNAQGVDGLAEVMALLGNASPGPWTVGITETDTGEIEVLSEGRPYVCMVLPGAVDETTRANAAAIPAAVNYLRSHGAAIAELVAAANEAADEIRRLRSAMFSTYAAAINGADHDRLLARVEKERDAYEAGFCGDRLEAALRQVEGK